MKKKFHLTELLGDFTQCIADFIEYISFTIEYLISAMLIIACFLSPLLIADIIQTVFDVNYSAALISAIIIEPFIILLIWIIKKLIDNYYY